MTIPPGQYYTLVILSVFSSTLSAICSGAIIASSRKDKSRSVYQTLILGLSAADLVGSFTTIFHSFLLPRRTREEGLLWASGNDATCSFAGFFFVSCYPLVSFFSMYLSAYFLMKVRYNLQDSLISKRFLWPGIAVAVVLCGSLAVVGSATHSFAPRVYHNVCSFGDCEIGKMDECTETYESGLSWYLGWVQVVFIAIPALCALTLTICVYVSVRARLTKGQRFVFGNNQQQQNHQRDKIVAVRNQALLYAFAYWNSFFFYFVYGVVGGDDYIMVEKQGEPFYFAISVLTWFLFPLQGVVNFAVYTRPRYLQWRKRNVSPCLALRKAISFQPVSATEHLRSTPVTGQDRTALSFHQSTNKRTSGLIPAFCRQKPETESQNEHDPKDSQVRPEELEPSTHRLDNDDNIDDEQSFG